MPTILRTPDESFDKIKDWPYEPQYVQLGDTRMHYVDEGPLDGEVILLLHGEPSWAYLYRKFIPILSKSYRVIAPDLIGFGKSDKYASVKDYTFKMHFAKMEAFLEELNLKDITVVVQDWGGLLGLPLLGEHPDKFKRVVVMNTYLPTGKRPMPMAFRIWKTFSQLAPNLPIGFVMKQGTHQKLSKEVCDAYKAPFPSAKYKAGAKIFPALVPGNPKDPAVPYMLKAREVLKSWDKPAIVIFSDKDPIMSGAWKWFYHNIPTAKDQERIIIKDAGHFLQEEKGEEIATHIAAFMKRTV
ncbi:MAG: alpha/beta fold hydrolase [Bacteroidetes bacterium]|nr:alpha/beta fold hydrolase [Bacteroidota bacterium]